MTVAPEHGLPAVPRDPSAAAGPRPDRREEAAVVADVDDALAATVRELAGHWEGVSPAERRSGGLRPEDVLGLVVDFVGSGGKRLRPRMTYWGWAAVDGPRTGDGRRDMITAATALELLHTFALVHDDIMDESEERRGQPSVHARARTQHITAGALRAAGRYGESIAILVGDLLHSEADALAARLPSTMRAVWRTLSIELIAGQARDLVGAANGRRDLGHARQVAAMKSGAYTVWRPLQLGALAAGAGPDTLAALRRFGLHVGVAFALRDDLLGVLGDPARTGKPVGDDIVAGKPTVLLALAEQRFSASSRLALRRAGTQRCSPEQAAALAEELVRCGVVAEVEDMIEAAVRAGSSALDDPSVDPAAAEGLRDLAGRMAWRDS